MLALQVGHDDSSLEFHLPTAPTAIIRSTNRNADCWIPSTVALNFFLAAFLAAFPAAFHAAFLAASHAAAASDLALSTTAEDDRHESGERIGGSDATAFA